MQKLYILAMLLQIADIASKNTQRLKVQWNSFHCESNPSFIEFHRCIIIEPAKALLTVEVQYNQTLEKTNASFVMLMPRPPSKEYHKIISLNVDLCQFHKSSQQNKFVAIAYKAMLKESNLYKICPQPKGFYYFRNMNIGEHLPPFLPSTEFKIQFNFYALSISIMNVTLNGQISELSRSKGK